MASVSDCELGHNPRLVAGKDFPIRNLRNADRKATGVSVDFPDLRVVWDKYSAVFSLHVQERFQYLGDWFWSSIYVACVVIVYKFIWTAIFNTQNTTVLMGFTLNQLIWYFLIAQLIAGSWMKMMIREVSDDIKSGTIAYSLTRPFSYIGFLYAKDVARAVCRWPAKIVVGGLVTTFLIGPPPHLLNLIPSLFLIFLGTSLDFFITATIALMSFWIEDSQAVYWVYRKMVFILGGVWVPIDVLPGWVQQAISWLPFPAIAYAPAKTFIELSWASFFSTLGLQVFWIVVIVAVLSIEFRILSKRLTVGGG